MIFDIFKEDATNNSSEFNFDAVQEEECTMDDPVLAALEIGYHIESAYSKLTEAVGIMELAAVQESGETIIYEGTTDKVKARVKSWFDTAKKFLTKWAGYIKGFFLKMFRMIESLFASDATFVKDNGKLIAGAKDAGGVEFTGYKYTLDYAIEADVSGLKLAEGGNYKDWVENLDEKAILSQARGTVAGASEGYDSDAEMRKELFKKFRAGKSAKESLKVSEAYGSAQGVVDAVKNTASAKEAANKDYKAAQKSVKAAIDAVDKLYKKLKDENDGKGDEDGMKSASMSLSMLKSVLRSENVAHGEHIKAIQANNRQARSVANMILHKKTKIKDDYVKKEGFEDADAATLNLAALEF
jgi:hypothetical protein